MSLYVIDSTPTTVSSRTPVQTAKAHVVIFVIRCTCPAPKFAPNEPTNQQLSK